MTLPQEIKFKCSYFSKLVSPEYRNTRIYRTELIENKEEIKYLTNVIVLR
jgi:hypothetical protein